MARKKLEVKEKEQQQQNDLSVLSDIVDSYAMHKDRANELDKLIKSESAEIKTLMNASFEEDENGKRAFDNGDYVVTLSTRDTSKMNEEKLIAYLKEHGLAKGIVKKKEYIDEKAFEDAVYNHKISDEQLIEMDTCKEYSTTQYLTYKKSGGK